MQVSVIIPVYNAEKFVRQAVESALALPETSEVILVEDCSTDGSLSVCQALEEEYPKVKLFCQPDGRNKGAGASRNLGILKARHEFISFLDADDFFLPGRFATAKKVFETIPEVDGVYEAIGVCFLSERAEKVWVESGRALITTMKRKVAPEDLYEAQAPIGNAGHTHLDGCIIKKLAFEKTGLFDEELRLHQDTVMFVKFSAMCKMVPGSLDVPVAMRGVHDHNRITANRSEVEVYRARCLMWSVLWRWSNDKLTVEKRQIVLSRYLEHASIPYRKCQSSLLNRILVFAQLFHLITRDVNLVLEKIYWTKLLFFCKSRSD